MKEVVLVVVAGLLAHGIAWCRDPMAGWRQKIEGECRQGMEDYCRYYGVRLGGEEAVVYPDWMAAGE